jgi:hypothetical protein
MRTLTSDWSFNKAGQGLFYTGCLRTHGKNTFWFVYDCGSSKGAAVLRQEVLDFKDRVLLSGAGAIDLLVISHFDADHISQISLLLKYLDCKIAVLPYLSTLERLNLYFHNEVQEAIDDEDYFAFISTPTAYLSERGVERIIYIDGNEEQGTGDVVNPEPNDSRKFEGDISLNPVVQMSAANTNSEQEILLNQYLGAEVVHAGRICSGNHWEFVFHQVGQSHAVKKEFKNLLRNVFEIALEKEYPDREELQKILQSQNKRKLLKDHFIDTFGDINQCSLVLLHGPVTTKHSIVHNELQHLYSGQKTYTLLTADANLREIIEVTGYLRNAIPDIKVFQVPHHGSRFSWSPWEDMTLFTELNAVINYGTGNTYGHPDPMVLNRLTLMFPKWKTVHNTEVNKFSYYITTYL